MRVIFTDNIAHHAGRFAIGLVVIIAIFVHRMENTSMHGLQAVAHIRQRARNNNAHGVIEIRGTHLFFDIYRTDIAAVIIAARRRARVRRRADPAIRFRGEHFFIDRFNIYGRVIVVIIAQFGTFGCGTNSCGNSLER